MVPACRLTLAHGPRTAAPYCVQALYNLTTVTEPYDGLDTVIKAVCAIPLTPAMDAQLQTWLEARGLANAAGWALCYSSPNGHPKDSPSEWHSRCDGHARTVVVGTNQHGYVFGGYASSPWSSPSSGARAAAAVFKTSRSFAFLQHTIFFLPWPGWLLIVLV